ncbi:hypothetical protein ACGFK1_19205 [Mycobacterium sp. NPDC048908]|uniref:hypothetical protein n=1 Tax=Mycobacterium sp. NPDC048908 TaxID=3364292 RepID=UPI00371497D9
MPIGDSFGSRKQHSFYQPHTGSGAISRHRQRVHVDADVNAESVSNDTALPHASFHGEQSAIKGVACVPGDFRKTLIRQRHRLVTPQLSVPISTEESTACVAPD